MKKIIFLLMIIFTFSGFSIIGEASSKPISGGIVDTSGSNLNIRSSASTSSSIKAQVKNNSYLTIYSTSGNFYYVEYKDGYFGYVHKSYVDVVSSNVKKVSTAGGNLNVRYGPAMSYVAFDSVVNNDYVIVLSDKGVFSNILFEGNKTGYVNDSYLANNYTYSSVKLSVPSYKQYDSRWASLTLGSSGKTIKQIGCLTTSIAMTESYRRGITVTPTYIRNNSRYTSDGSIYWPSNYVTSTNSNYLSTAYNLLKSGKPVLIGLKTKTGGQHWVVITGFTGGNTLGAGNFIINDPGSSTRTRLSEVINAYPLFYKIAYYK
jgi:uncharacterized protein YgiM (DUF1202 family)